MQGGVSINYKKMKDERSKKAIYSTVVIYLINHFEPDTSNAAIFREHIRQPHSVVLLQSHFFFFYYDQGQLDWY